MGRDLVSLLIPSPVLGKEVQSNMYFQAMFLPDGHEDPLSTLKAKFHFFSTHSFLRLSCSPRLFPFSHPH